MTETKTAARTTKTQHENLAAALAAVQSEIPSVTKGATATVKTNAGGEYKYQYADLAVITPLILPLLGRNGLAWTTLPTMMGDTFVLHYQLTHESGESIEGVYPLQNPTQAKPQEIGSAITYARRYALCAVTGVAPGGDDDDAAAANDRPVTNRAPKQQKPQRDWKKSISDAKDLATLTALANEAQQDGHWADVITDDAGETSVGQALHARRGRIEEATTPPMTGAGTAKARDWATEIKALEFAEDAQALFGEATHLEAPKKVLEELAEKAGTLKKKPEAAPEGEPWAPVAEDEKPAPESEVEAEPSSDGQAAVLATDEAPF